MNISIYKKYATNVESIEECKNLIEEAFSIVFLGHESSYTGLYFRAIFFNSTLILSRNYNVVEDYWTALDFKTLNTILSVSITDGKKIDRLETDKAVCERLAVLNFQLVGTFEKDV